MSPEICSYVVDLGQNRFSSESLILAQNERWRRGLGMQVERTYVLRFAHDSGAQAILNFEESLLTEARA